MPSASSPGLVIAMLPFCILILFSSLTVQTIFGSWSQISTNMLCLLLGAAATTVLKIKSSMIFKYLAPRSSHEHSPDIYSLDHGRLNIALPPQTMWMKHGILEKYATQIYSDNQYINSARTHHATFADTMRQDTSDFPAACEGLVLEVLKTAKLLAPEIRTTSWNRYQTIRVLDLGFGCGDQNSYTAKAWDSRSRLGGACRGALVGGTAH